MFLVQLKREVHNVCSDVTFGGGLNCSADSCVAEPCDGKRVESPGNGPARKKLALATVIVVVSYAQQHSTWTVKVLP